MTKARYYVPEHTILKSLPIDDNDDLQLIDCQVLDPNTKEPVSLLTASVFNPVTVTGTLQPLPKSKWHHYLQTQYRQRQHHIEIADVARNAFGEYDDGTYGLWLSGKTGWYHIEGANEYKSMMNFMREDIRIFYYIADAYKEKRVVGKGKSARELRDFTAKELFAKYAAQVIKDPMAVEEAAEVIYRHSDFILSCMVAGKEGLQWSQNLFYRHLARKFPDVLATAKQRIFGPTGSQKARSIEESSTTTERRSIRGRSVRNPRIISADSSSLSSLPASSATRTRARRLPYRTEAAMPEPPGLATPVRGHDEDEDDEYSTIDDSDDALPIARKGKSALRPRPSKGLKQDRRLDARDEDDEPTDEHGVDSRPKVMMGKRKSVNLLFDERPGKRRSSRADVDEGIDMPSSPASSQVDSGSESPSTPPPAPAGASVAEQAVRLNHYPDSVQEDTWICALDGCMHKVYSASSPDSQQLIKEHYKLHIFDNDERVRLVKKLQAPSLPVSHLMERVRLQASVEEVGGSTRLGDYVGPGGIVGSRVAGSRFPDPVLKRI